MLMIKKMFIIVIIAVMVNVQKHLLNLIVQKKPLENYMQILKILQKY